MRCARRTFPTVTKTAARSSQRSPTAWLLLLKDYYGRGPTQAKTYYEDDLVVCLLRGGFTRVEQTLLDGGRGHAVIQQRMEFQEVMRERFEAVIEQATGRRVVGFMSGNQQDPDMICEVFILTPTDLVDDDELSADRRVTGRTCRAPGRRSYPHGFYVLIVCRRS